ncbi:MAG: repressor LexA [Candidatus Brennerbacteria bacterium]|nr:repressor LexA [Candidatus Brennerbacteria bacterium]
MLTDKKKEVLDFVTKYARRRGYSPSIPEIAAGLKRAVGTVHEHLQNLEDAGYLQLNKNQRRGVQIFEATSMVQIPLLGTIVAGQPLTLFDTPTETIAVPANRIPNAGNVYALRVQGESMVEENINDSDIILVRHQSVAENGQKVVALIDNYDTTLKTYYKERNQIRLQPANKNFEPIIVKWGKKDFAIQGVFVDVIRNKKSAPAITPERVAEKTSGKKIVDKKTWRNVSIYLADCLDAFKSIDTNSVDFIATDPPYFLDGMDNEWSDAKLKQKSARAGAIQGLPVGMKFDPEQGKKLEKFFTKVFHEALRVLKPGGFMISFSQGRLFHRLALAAENAGFEIRDMLIWEHNGGQGKAFTQNHFVKKMKIPAHEKEQIIKSLENRKTPQLRPKFEAILLAHKPKEGTFVENWLTWRTGLIQTDFPESQQTTVLNYKKPNSRKLIDHMTIKPIDLMERLIEIFTSPKQTVFDPFMGSGTTGVAALRKNRKFIGFEIEKKYFAIAEKRLKNYEKTG